MTSHIEALPLGSPFRTPTTKRITQYDCSPPDSSPRWRNSPKTRIKQPRFEPLETTSEVNSLSLVQSSPLLLQESHAPIQRDVPTLASLNDLPAEIIEEIHALAHNKYFPLTTKYTYNVLCNASPKYIAKYFLEKYKRLGPRDILTHSLHHPIVTIQVVQEIQRLWDQKRGYISSQDRDEIIKKRSKRKKYSDYSGDDDSDSDVDAGPSTPKVTAPGLEVVELPRRLFRPKPSADGPAISPMITFLIDTFRAPVSSHKGFPLIRSVINLNHELVAYLLQKGASTTERENFSIKAAIQKQDLRMVKMLIEHVNKDQDTERAPNPKKRRLQPRIQVDAALVKLAIDKGTPEIVEYLVNERGGLPPLDTIMSLGSRK